MAHKLIFDRVLFASVMALVGLGLVMVYSSTAAVARNSGSTLGNVLFLKQVVEE